MNAQEFLAALAPTLTDAEARDRFIADPRGALATAGMDLPEWFAVTAREGETPGLTITLPGLISADAELSEEDLAMVAGGHPIWICRCPACLQARAGQP